MKNKQPIFKWFTIICSFLLILNACDKPTDGLKESEPQVIYHYPVAKFVANPYTSTSNNDKIKYSFTYDDCDFYYIYLGELENIPMFFQEARYHSGIDWTYTFTKTESMTNSIRTVVTESSQTTTSIIEENTKSKTTGGKLSSEINSQLGVKYGILSAGIGAKIKGEQNWSEYTSTNTTFIKEMTTSLTSTVENAASYTLSTIESDQFHLNSNNKVGYYRYTMFSTSDVYLYVVKNSKTNEIFYEFREYVIPNTYFWHLDYSETSSFRKSDKTGFELDISILENLPKPTLNFFISYAIEYNANGGSGTMGQDIHRYGIEQNLLKNNFTPPVGYSFAGWSRSPNAENTEFSDGDLVLNLTDVKDATVKLYAVWSLDVVTMERTFRAGENLITVIPANVTKAIIRGERGAVYTNSEIIVLNRILPLTIELYDVNAVGRNGNDGGVGQSGETGKCLISMGNDNAPVPDLTIVSYGENKLYGGKGGDGGQGNNNSTGSKGGNGGAAITANLLTITGDSNIALQGGNGGNGGRGGNLGTSLKGTSGGNGGNGGASINGNNITINITGIVYALKSKGGDGGPRWHGSTGLATGGSSGSQGTQGVQFTSTPQIISGLVRDKI